MSAPRVEGEARCETDPMNCDEPMTVKEAAKWARNSRAVRNFGDERAFQRCCQTIRLREEAVAALTAEVERLTKAINWAMGCGPEDDFPVCDDRHRYAWRPGLSRRAGLVYDSACHQYVAAPVSK